MLRGFDRPTRRRASAFLMPVFPVMLAAGTCELLDVLQMPHLTAFLLPLAAGFVSAAVSGWLAVRWLIGYREQTFAVCVRGLLRGGRNHLSAGALAGEDGLKPVA